MGGEEGRKEKEYFMAAQWYTTASYYFPFRASHIFQGTVCCLVVSILGHTGTALYTV